MTIAIGVHTIAGGFLGSGGFTTTGINTQATGSTFVAYYVGEAYTTGTIVDSKSNTWVHSQVDVNINGTFTTMNIWTCQNGTGGSGHTVTFTPGTYPGYVCGFLEITGAAAASLDQNPTATTGNSATMVTPSATTTSANELLLGIIMAATNVTFSAPTNGFTILDQQVDGSNGESACILTNIVTSTGTYSTGATASGAQLFAGALLTFIQAPPANSASIAWVK